MLAALLACASHVSTAQDVGENKLPYGKGLPVPGRSVIATQFGIVATSQPLASSAGVQILERGGNAIDAAIAANATLGVTEPMMNGIGGDLFAIIYEKKSGKLYGLNASGWAATGMTAEFVASKVANGRMPQRGVYTVDVPGAVAGWDAMHKKFGKLPFRELLAPAIYYAQNGYPVAEVTAGIWAAAQGYAYTNDAFKSTFVPGGHAPRGGELFRNPDLAGSLRRIAAGGFDGFYRGPTAAAVLATIKENGGTMTAADLAEFTPEWVTPLSTKYRDWTVYELPPNGQGLAALEMLNIMSRYPIAQYGWASAKAMHVEIEAKKLAYADLLKYIGDPRFSKLPVQQLLSADHAASRAAQIDESKANCHVTPSKLAGIEAGASETIYMTVVDQDGNIVSLIQSNYSAFGSGLVAKGTGFAMHNRGGLFTLERGQPNTIAPRKRPLHTIIPGFMEKGDVKIGFGIMGGWNQSQAHAQFVSDIADFGMNIKQALEASRFTKLTFDGCDVYVEANLPSSVVAELKALGHEPQVRPARVGSDFGFGQVVMTNADGVHFGASDPRHDGAAMPQGAPIGGRKK
ncbi:MAG: gamma-glutamyltransferase [Gemmatimonadetes bacterium]|nr:gamma-glutamyltransferase [Gemmatimonadota bacterium]